MFGTIIPNKNLELSEKSVKELKWRKAKDSNFEYENYLFWLKVPYYQLIINLLKHIIAIFE